ncbi:MAG TPA: hypothetical protein VF072_15645 [Thermoleophilaceae bacterium]
MKRSLVVLLLAGLALAPAASAKGPHAILTTPRETVEPGKPWQFTVELNEFRHPPVPAVIGRRGARTVGAEVERTPASIDGAAGFRFTMIFPRKGRWALRLFAGKRRFAFPAVVVGGAVLPRDYVAFPVGSEMARQGAGGVWTTDEAGEPAAPVPAEAEGGMGPWVLPLLGVVLAGAGVAAVTRRGSRRVRRRPTGAARRPSRG